MPAALVALLVWVVLAVVAAPPADATVVSIDGRPAQPYQRWVARALVPTPGGTVTLSLGPCPLQWAPACTWLGGPIVLDASLAVTSPRGELRDLFMHELGHQFDFRMPSSARERFRRVVGTRGRWRADGIAEQFADAYALCARRHRIRGVQFIDDYLTTPRRHRAACRLIWKAARGDPRSFDFPRRR